MTSLLEILDAVYRFGLPVLLVPIAIWTLLHPLVRLLLGTRLFAHPDARYLGHLAWLAGLPVSIAVAAVIHATGFHPPQFELPLIPLPEISVSAVGVSTGSVLSLRHVVGGLILVVGLVIALRSLRLVSRWRLARSLATPVVATPQWLDDMATEWKGRIGIIRRVRTIVADDAAVPMTIGIRHPVVVMPRALLDDVPSLTLALTHELVHVGRFDDAIHAFECFVDALFGWHPAVRRLCVDLPAHREVACDAAVIAFHRNRVRNYAGLLLRFASRPLTPVASVVSISDSPNTIKKRIEAMTTPESTPTRVRTVGFVLGAMLFGIAGFVVACTDVVNPTSEATPEVADKLAPPPPPEELFVVVEEMPKVIGGFESVAAKLQYPPIAKKAGITGRVFIELVVDKEGNVRDAKVLRGIGGGCDEEALRVVKSLKFEPGLQRGVPVPVKLSLPIEFRLS